MRLYSTCLCAVAFSLALVAQAQRAVFAHYMVGNTDSDHVGTDIEDAIAMGLDGFALNIQCPGTDFADQLVTDMWSYIVNNVQSDRQFSVMISMDVYALGSCNGTVFDYVDYIKTTIGQSVNYMVDGKALVTTYSDGGLQNTTWEEFKESFTETQIFFMPDFDNTTGYWTGDDGWWYYWGGVVDGLFSWESAWPPMGESAATQEGSYGGVARDDPVISGCEAHGAPYMMPLSLVQYKNSYSTNVFRDGFNNFVQRMHDILTIESDTLQYVEYISWNDGPEGHYIGNLWPEQNTDVGPHNYADPAIWPHDALRPILHSFNVAFKNNQGPSDMRSQDDSVEAVGALLYHILAVSEDGFCPFNNVAQWSFWAEPLGWHNADLNYVHWVVVLGDSVSGYDTSSDLKITIVSGGTTVEYPATPGLNFGYITNMEPLDGPSLQVTTATGVVLYRASGGKCPLALNSCDEGFYNLNYQVIPLVKGSGFVECTEEETTLHYTPANISYSDNDISCSQLASDDAADQWYHGQGGLVLEYEINHNDAPGYPGTQDLDQYIASFVGDNVASGQDVTGCALYTSASACRTPEQCPTDNDYKPYYVVQRAFGIFHSCLNELSQGLFNEAFLTSLQIPDMVTDVQNYLTVETDGGMGNLFGLLSAGFTIGAGALGPFSPWGAAFTTIGAGITSLISTIGSPGDPTTINSFIENPATALTDRLLAILLQYNQTLGLLGDAVFSSRELNFMPSDMLAASDELWDYYTTDVAKFFAGGRFSDSTMDCANMAGPIANPFTQSLIGYMLFSSNVYVLQNSWPTDNCDGASSGVLLDLDGAGSVCYTVESPSTGFTGDQVDDVRNWYSKPLDSDFVEILTSSSSRYGIDLAAMIKSSVDCQTQQNSYNGTYSLNADITADDYSNSNLPPCFFNLPVLYDMGGNYATPCALRQQSSSAGVGYYLPSWLANIFTSGYCETGTGCTPELGNTCQ